MNDQEPDPPTNKDSSDLGKAAIMGVAEAGVELAGSFTRILYGVVCIAIGFGVFIGIGEAADYWSPALGLAALGAGALLGKRFWNLHRYTIAAGSSFVGAALGAVLGSTEGMGFQAVLVAAVIAVLALFAPFIPGCDFA